MCIGQVDDGGCGHINAEAPAPPDRNLLNRTAPRPRHLMAFY